MECLLRSTQITSLCRRPDVAIYPTQLRTFRTLMAYAQQIVHTQCLLKCGLLLQLQSPLQDPLVKLPLLRQVYLQRNPPNQAALASLLAPLSVYLFLSFSTRCNSDFNEEQIYFVFVQIWKVDNLKYLLLHPHCNKIIRVLLARHRLQFD